MFSPHLLIADGSPARRVSCAEGAVTDSDGILAGPTERIGPVRGYREGAVGGGMFIDIPYTPCANGTPKIKTIQANIQRTR